MFSVFHSSYRNTCESLGERKKSSGNTGLLWLMFPPHCSFSQNSTCVSITIETQCMFSILVYRWKITGEQIIGGLLRGTLQYAHTISVTKTFWIHVGILVHNANLVT